MKKVLPTIITLETKMTKILFLLTTILIITIENYNYSQEFDTDRVGYQVMCINDHSAKVSYVSNVFYCREMHAEFNNIELVENKIGKELSSNTDGWSHFYKDKKELSEKRNGFISEAKRKNYEVIRFKVECKNGAVN